MLQTSTNLVEVVSTEMIKPSSPTPPHLRKMKRSYLDTLLNPMYVSLVFFYETDHDDEGRRVTITSQRLKESLSHTLTSFYPLAGRFQDNHIIDCNDSGVVFIDARVHAQLKDSIQEPHMEDLKQYIPLPVPATTAPTTDGALFLVQINYFDCGGIAVGVCFSHQMADCTSIMAFINAWADTSRRPGTDDGTKTNPISFDLAKYFPSREPPTPWEPSFMSNEKFTTKRFVFDKVKLSALRELADDVDKPSRVELVSAFIWRSFMDAESNNYNAFTAFHAVNMRPRKSPPQLLENVFGNCFIFAYAFSDSNEEFPEVVRKLRNTIRKIDDGYITESQVGNVYLNDLDKSISPATRGEIGWGGFTSWCWFPFYEVDFGWGKPIYVCTTAVPFKNVTILVKSKCGEEIEAWVNMDEDDLNFIEAEFKLI